MSIARNGSLENEHFLESLFKIHYGPVFRYINSRVNNDFDADEITLDCFFSIFLHLEEIENFRAVLFKAAKNKIVDFSRRGNSRRRKVEMVSLDDEDNGIAKKLSVEQEFYGDQSKGHFEELQQILIECVSNFPEWERQVLEMQMDGCSKSEIAERVGRSEKKIAQDINRINMRLKYQARKILIKQNKLG